MGDPAASRARAVAHAAEHVAERRSPTLDALRAVTRAAQRPGGIDSAIVELARRLGTWVGLFDATGALRREHPSALPAEAADQLRDGVRDLVRRGAQAATTIRAAGTPIALQTLGVGGRLRGVLAIAADELDPDQRTVTATVAAMASLALAHDRRVGPGEAALRAGVAELITSPDSTLTHRVARELGGALPPPPLVVATFAAGRGGEHPAIDWLDERAEGAARPTFFGRAGGDVVVIAAAADAGTIDDLAATFAMPVGVATAERYRDLGPSFERARRARPEAAAAAVVGEAPADADAHGAPGSRSARGFGGAPGFGSATAFGGAAVLEPLIEHDSTAGTALLSTVRAWVGADCQIDATARALDVHRHTVRARLEHAQRLLGRELGAMSTRAELYLALRALL
ncbi:MAG: helix-turn-helix domain-containing protein [Pseudoclavibacter sp.]